MIISNHVILCSVAQGLTVSYIPWSWLLCVHTFLKFTTMLNNHRVTIALIAYNIAYACYL